MSSPSDRSREAAADATVEVDADADVDPGTGGHPSESDSDSDTVADDSRLVDLESDVLGDGLTGADPAVDDGSTEASDDGQSGSLTSRLFGGGGGLFSLRVFVPTLVVLIVGLVAGSAVPLVGAIGRFVGLFAAAFAVGLVVRTRHYLEVGTAALAASGLGFLLSVFSGQFLGLIAALVGGDPAQVGLVVGGVGVGTGVLVSLAGYYFGRDLRSGLTADLGE
jgi:hypothetical protein